MSRKIEKGRYTDGLIANLVLGWKQEETKSLPTHHWPWFTPEGVKVYDTPHYSGSGSAALSLLDVMMEKGFRVDIIGFPSNLRYRVELRYPKRELVIGVADSFALAMCRACILAMTLLEEKGADE